MGIGKRAVMGRAVCGIHFRSGGAKSPFAKHPELRAVWAKKEMSARDKGLRI